MSESWLADKLAAGPEAPTGLQQQVATSGAERPAPESPAATGSWLADKLASGAGAPRWESGGQTGSVENGWNTPFYQQMFEQQKEQQEKGNLHQLYGRQDYTGIATWDQKVGERDVKYGDVYENGRKVGNLYEQYDRPTADKMLAQLTLDADTQKRVYAETPRNPDAIHRALQAQRTQTNSDVKNWTTSKDYELAVTQTEKQIEGGLGTGWAGADEAAGIGGAALASGAAGAGIGALAGPVGAAVGGLVGAVAGGLGAWMNQDELTEQAARVQEQTKMAERDFGTPAAIATGVAGWSGLAMKASTPFTNILHGAYELSADGKAAIGDGDAQWYTDVDPVTGESNRPGWWTAAQFGTGVADAVTQFASPIGQALFIGSMTGVVAGQVAQLPLTGGSTFDDRRGAFDNIFTDDQGNPDIGSAAAGIMNIGIDAVQLGMGRGLIRTADDAAIAAGAREPGRVRQLVERLRGGKSTEVAGGYAFTRGADGAITAARPSVAMLAPSEALQAVSARVLAQRAAMKDGGRAVTADDLYRSTQSLQNGTAPIKQALVTAFGEGGEEAAQAVLEPWSHGANPDGEDVFESFLQGAAMGAGMSVGTNIGSGRPSADERMRAQADLARASVDGKKYSDTAWNGMSDIDRRAAAASTPLATEQQRMAYENLAAAQRTDAVGSQVAIAKYNDAVTAVRESEMNRGTQRTDGAFRITQLEDADHPNHAVGASLATTATIVERHLAGLQIQLDTLEAAGDAEGAARTEAVLLQGGELMGVLSSASADFEAASDELDQRDVVDGINEVLRSAFEDTEVPGRARAATLVFVRDPQDQSGSYLGLMPQVSLALTASGEGDGFLQISHGVLQQIGGDFDGDKIREQAQLVLDDEAFINLRSGMGNLGANGTSVNIGTRTYEETTVELLADALRYDSGLQSEATDVVQDISYEITDRYDGVIPVTSLGRLLDQFSADMAAGSAKARANLLNALASQHGQAMTDYARENLSNEWLWLDQTIQSRLQEFQSLYAARRSVLSDINTTPTNPIRQSANYKSVLLDRAVNASVQMFHSAQGFSPFRMFQKLHYSSVNSSVVGAGVNVQELEELTQWYELLGQGMTASELELVEAKDDVTRRVLWQLEKLAAQAVDELGISAANATSLVANMQVPDYDPAGEFLGVRSLTQTLLRRANEAVRAEVAPVLEGTPTLQSQIAARDRMTREGNAEAAFVEVFAQVPLYRVMGSGASVMASNITVEQAVRTYTSQNESLRQATKLRLMAEPEYVNETGKSIPYPMDQLEQGQVTAYASVVDAIVGQGNKRISMVSDGRSPHKGLANGEMGDIPKADGHSAGRSRAVHETIVAGFSRVRAALEEVTRLVGDMDPLRNTADLRRVFETDPDWGRAVLDLIPNAAANAVFEVRDGKIYVSNWVYDMLQMEPEAAAMHYWRNVTVAQWNALGVRLSEETGRHGREYDRLTHRIHQLMYRLQELDDGGARYTKFIADMTQSTSLPAFLKQVNLEFRANEAPYTMWLNDAADFDVDKASGGWSSVIDGSEQREKITAFKNKSERLLTTLRSEVELDAVDTGVMQLVADALDENGDVDPSATDTAKNLAVRLQRAIEFAKKNLTALGPAAMQYQTVGSMIGFFANATDKGKSPAPYTAPGALDVLGDTLGFKPGFGQHEQATGAVDLDDVAGNMAMLARDGLLTMGPDGLPIRWDVLDARRITELWLTNRDARSALRAILFPQVQERTPDNGVSMQLLTGKSMKELLSGDVYSQFFEPTRRSRALYNSLIEARAKGYDGSFAVQKVANDASIARLSGMGQELTPDVAEKVVGDTYSGIADILRRAGELSDAGLLAVQASVRKRLAAMKLRGRLRLEDSDETVDAQLDAILESQRQQALAVEAAAGPEAGRAAMAELERFEEKLDLIKSDSVIDHLAARYRIDWDDARDVAARKGLITDFVMSHGTLHEKAAWAHNEISALRASWLDPTSLDPDGLPRLHSNDAEAQKSWDVLSRAIVAAHLDDLASATADGVSVPQMADLDREGKARFWDPTFSYLVDDLLNPASALVRAARDLNEEANRLPEAEAPLKELEDLVFRTIYAEWNLGDWTSDIPVLSIRSRELLDSGSVSSAISASGLSPMREVTLSAATQRTYDAAPPADTVSSASLTMEDLAGSDLTEVDFQLGVSGGEPLPGRMALAQLNGRFVNAVTLTFGDQSVDLLTDPSFELGWQLSLHPNAMSSGFKTITLGRLRAAMRHALPDDVAPDGVRVEISFLHPDSQPAAPEFANSAFYEGTSFELPTQQQLSLNAELWFVDAAISPRGQTAALQANKKGKRAFLVNATIPDEQRVSAEVGWQQDFGAVLRRKTTWLMRNDPGDGHLEPAYYNAVHKRQKMLHFVQGVTPEGEVVLWSAEQVLNWQQANPSQPITVALQQARLWQPSPQALRTLLGELGDQGFDTLPDGAIEVDPSEVPLYTGDVTVTARDTFPDLMELDADGLLRNGDLFSTLAASRSFQSTLSIRPPLDDAARSAAERGVAFANARTERIHEARRATLSAKEMADQAERAGRFGGQALDQGRAELDYRRAGIPGLMARDTSDSLLSRALMKEITEATKADSWNTGWIVQLTKPGTTGKTAANGYLTQTSLDPGAPGYSEPARYSQVATGDFAVFDVDSAEQAYPNDTPRQYKAATQLLDRLMGARARVILVENGSGGDLRAEMARYLDEHGYEKVAGLRHVWQPAPMDSRFINQQSRERTLVETHGITGRDHVLAFLAEGVPYTENAAGIVDHTSHRSVGVSMNLVPTSALHDFNVPIAEDQASIADVKQQIRGLVDPGHPEGWELLLRLSEIEDPESAEAASLRRAVEKLVDFWDAHPSEPGVLPTSGEWGTGDIVPLYNTRTRELVLYRHGHTAPTHVQRRVQLATPTSDGTPAGIAVYGTETMPNATTHVGQLERFEPRSKYGLSVKLRIPLQSFGDKWQLEGNGMKYVLTPLADSVKLPDHPVFPEWGIDLVTDWDSAYSKESLGGVVNNFRNAFALLGVDFMPELKRFFFGPAADTADAAKSELLDTAVRELLGTVRRMNYGRLTPSRAKEILEMESTDISFSELLGDITLGDPRGLGLVADWKSRLASSQGNPDARIARGILTYLMLPTAKLSHVLSTGGLNNDDSRSSDNVSALMPRIFTDYLGNTRIGDPLRKHLFDKLNDQISNPGSGYAGYTLRQDWKFQTRSDDGDVLEGYLQFAEVHSSGDNPVTDQMAFDRATSQKVSPHATSMAFQAIAARTARAGSTDQLDRFAARDGVPVMDSISAVQQVLFDIPATDSSNKPWMTKTVAEEHYMSLAHDVVGTFRQELDVTDWSEEDRAEYDRVAAEVIRAYGLDNSRAAFVDFWVRQVLGMPKGEGFEGKIGGRAAIGAVVEDILANARGGYLPTYGAEVPQLHYIDLSMIHRANLNGGTFTLREGPGSVERITASAQTWDDWASVALDLGDTSNDYFDPMYLTAVDGFLHTYYDAGERLAGLPVSRDVLRARELMDQDSTELVLSVNPNRQLVLGEPMMLDTAQQTLSDLMGAERTEGRVGAKLAPASVRAKRRAARRKWRKENGVPEPKVVTLKNFREHGDQFVTESTNTHALLRMAVDLRAANALFNPFLWASSFVEVAVRGTLEDATNLLTGESTGFAGRALSKVSLSQYSPDQQRRFRQLHRTLGGNPAFRSMVYQELVYKRDRLYNAGLAERITSGMARTSAQLQDASYGMRADALGRRYLESVLSYMATRPTETVVSPEAIAARLSTDAQWVANNVPDAHRAALNTIASVRSMKQTPMSMMLRSIYEPLSSNPNPWINIPSTLLLKIPMLFSTYISNVTTTILGGQGASALTAMFLEGRNKPGLLRKLQATMSGVPLEDVSETFDMSEAIEGMDLSKAFIQSGLTHTALFATGMAAGTLGLSGEDEEDRRRRRAAYYQGAGYVYDPRKLQNDFLNADAIFLDNIPILNTLFKVTGDENGAAGRSIANLHWTLRQFISPIVGMEKFFETGDTRHILWGFEDALGSFPLINETMLYSGVQTYKELISASKQVEADGGPASLPDAHYFMLSAVAAMEKMLFENTFVNMVMVGLDKYDRDPWKLPELDSAGEIQRDRLDVPRPTMALESFVDPETGEVRQGYVSRDWMDGQVHTLAENRSTLALMMNLFTGQGLSGSYSRQNMVAKTRTIERPELSQDEAEDLVLSLFDSATGEQVTKDGAKGIYNGLWRGTVKLGDPSLEGVYVPFEMRQEIQAEWMAELIQEGMDLGLSESKAKSRMYKIWNGPGDDPTVLGLKDILWDDRLNYAKDMKYYQLNTTYTIGPDGKPWATGATRDSLHNFFGIVPLNRYYTGDVGNLDVDGRLNSVDSALLVNTGMRGLERIDESWNVPTAEEIGKSIEKALTQAMAGQYQASGNGWQDFGNGSGWKNFGNSRRKGSGWVDYGSGSGWSNYSWYRVQAPQYAVVPYANDIPYVNISNPIIRRATIRRERFSSQRGRLNQWQ